MSKCRKAVYAGTFDPITKGHIDIARRGAALFDQVIVAVAEDNYKSNLFTTEERCALATEALSGVDNITVMPFRDCWWISATGRRPSSSSAACGPCPTTTWNSRWRC